MLPRTADAVVIGAGIFGASTAYRLCERGAGSVVLLDRLGLCRGDSGRTFGMVRRHYSNAATARLAMRGTRTIQGWAEEIGVCDAGFVRTGYLLTVPEALAAACRDNVSRLRALGLETSFVGPDEIRSVEPLLSLEGIAGGAYEPDAGFADAGKMVLGWYAGAVQRGLVSGIGVEAQELLVSQGRVRGVRTSQGEIACERVVLATGAWGLELLAPLGVELPLSFRASRSRSSSSPRERRGRTSCARTRSRTSSCAPTAARWSARSRTSATTGSTARRPATSR